MGQNVPAELRRAEALLEGRELEPSTPRGEIFTIFGAKGGTGKSTLAVNLAAAVSLGGEESVLVIDLDTRFGDIAIMMGVSARHTVSELAVRVDDLTPEAFRQSLSQHESGAMVLAAPRHPSEWATVTSTHIRQLVEMGASLFDYVILDTPGTFNDVVATGIAVADRVIAVSSLDMTSVRETAYMLDRLEADGMPSERVLLVLNDVNDVDAFRTPNIAKLVHHPVFWSVPYDATIMRATQLGRPIVMMKPDAPSGMSLLGFANRVAGRDTPVVKRRRRWPIIGRLIRAA